MWSVEQAESIGITSIITEHEELSMQSENTPPSAPVDSIVLLRLHFREMCLRFLDGMNPQPDKAIVIADAICSYDADIDTERAMRYEAHDFVHEALKVIQQDQPMLNGRRFNQWLHRWNAEFGVK